MGAIVNLLQLVANLLLPGIGGIIVGSIFGIIKSLGIFSLFILIPIFYIVHFVAPMLIGITIGITIFISYMFPSVYKLLQDKDGKLGVKGLLKAWLLTHAITVAITSITMSVLLYIFIQVA